MGSRSKKAMEYDTENQNISTDCCDPAECESPENSSLRLVVTSFAKSKKFLWNHGFGSFIAQLGEGASAGFAVQDFSGVLTTIRISFDASSYLRAACEPASLLVGTCLSPGQISVNGKRVKPLQFFVIMPGANIDAVVRQGTKLCLVRVPLSELDTNSAELYRDLLQAMANRTVYVSRLQRENESFRCWLQLWEAISSGRGDPGQIDILPRLFATVVSLLKTFAAEPHRPAARDTAEQNWTDSGVKRLIDYFHNNPEEAISIDDACRLAEMGRRNLYYQFRKYTGLSPQKFFSRIRLSYLRHELQSCEQSITELALKYNFHHLGDFASAYRLVYGELPSETRKSMAESESLKLRKSA